MEDTVQSRALVIALLMALTSVTLWLERDIPASDTPPIRLVLPGRVGDYEGRTPLFCQNELCLGRFTEEDIGAGRACPDCEGELARISLGENRILPPDTVIVKKDYVSSRRTISVSIVLSGVQQKSIHRPQQCLPAQGHVVDRSRAIVVPDIPGRPSLKMMLLDTRRRVTVAGAPRDLYSAFSYWFIGKDRETPYHLERLLWMSADRILKGASHRWAYVAIATDRDPDSETHVELISAFVRTLYPLIVDPSPRLNGAADRTQ